LEDVNTETLEEQRVARFPSRHPEPVGEMAETCVERHGDAQRSNDVGIWSFVQLYLVNLIRFRGFKTEFERSWLLERRRLD